MQKGTSKLSPLVLKIIEYVILYGKSDFEAVIKVMNLK